MRTDGPSLRDYLRVTRRRKWVVVAAVALVPLTAVVASLLQQRIYEASAEVLLGRQNLAASLTGTQDPNASLQPDRLAQTQADVARAPEVARRTLDATGVKDSTPEDLIDASSVFARQNADLLEFEVRDPSPALASRLATEYARQFIRYRRELDTAAFVRARREVAHRLRALEADGDRRSPLHASLLEKEQQLRTMEALQTSNASLLSPGGIADQVQPKPLRNGILGLVLGLVLGIALAFLREALDTRVRSADEVGAALDLPLLARLPSETRKLRRKDELVMLAHPASAQAEMYRMLRAKLEFANLERAAQIVMVTSAVEGEGKSTTAANLAVAFARGGTNVLLVDLDFRRPSLDRFFGLVGSPGLTDVALDHVELEAAVTRVALGAADASAAAANGRNGAGSIAGVLEVVPLGPTPPDPGEFAVGRALPTLLERLRARADLIVVDSPPILQVGDALALAARADALVVVTQLGVVRRETLGELARALEACPTAKLGVVLTGAHEEDSYAGSHRYAGGWYSWSNGPAPRDPAVR
jgi:Mrp family chromosome partitioning ATPase/capsular polysaccharide biosynthesis protein